MKIFIRELLKQFHPDNKETGNAENFIKVKNAQVNHSKLNLRMEISMEEFLNGFTRQIGGDLIKFKAHITPDFEYSYTSNDGTKSAFKFNVNDDLDIHLRKTNDGYAIVQRVNISMFDAMFGGRMTYSVYKPYRDVDFQIKPMALFKNDEIILYKDMEDVMKRPLPYILKFNIEKTNRDERFIKKLRKIYEEE